MLPEFLSFGKIDGIDASALGLAISNGTDTFKAPYQAKEGYSYDWGSQNGKQFDLSSPVYKQARIFKIDCWILADSTSDFDSKYQAIQDLFFSPGARSIFIKKFNITVGAKIKSFPSFAIPKGVYYEGSSYVGAEISIEMEEVIGYVSSGKLNQIIYFQALPSKVLEDPDFTPTVTSSSGLPVTLTSSNTDVAVILSGAIHIIGEGSTFITATQPGDSEYNAAQPVVREFVVSNPAFYRILDTYVISTALQEFIVIPSLIGRYLVSVNRDQDYRVIYIGVPGPREVLFNGSTGRLTFPSSYPLDIGDQILILSQAGPGGTTPTITRPYKEEFVDTFAEMEAMLPGDDPEQIVYYTVKQDDERSGGFIGHYTHYKLQLTQFIEN